MSKEVVFQPFTLLPKPCEQGLRWLVHVTVTSPETGKALLVSRHECRDRHHAAVLLSEIRELAEELAEFLPGLGAVGYELAEAVSPGQSFGEAVAESSLSAGDKAYWQKRGRHGRTAGRGMSHWAGAACKPPPPPSKHT